MSDRHYITLALSPAERKLLLRLLKADGSDLAHRVQEQIEHLLEKAREDANRRHELKVRSQRLDAARVVAGVFAERHGASFPGSRGGINQNVERWVERQAEVALGIGSDRGLPNIRAEYLPRVQMAREALLHEMRTPEGLRRAAAAEAQRLRTLAAEWTANPRFSTPNTTPNNVSGWKPRPTSLIALASFRVYSRCARSRSDTPTGSVPSSPPSRAAPRNLT